MIMLNENEILFEDILDAWLEEIRQTHAISTYVKYTHIVEKHIRPYFRDMPIKEVTPDYLKKFSGHLEEVAHRSKDNGNQKDHLSRQKKIYFSANETISHTMIQNTIMIANMAMKMAFRQGIIDEWNSVSCRRKRKKVLVQVFSTEDQAKLEGYIKENWSQTGFGIYLCLYTGMRLGEICALKWKNINTEAGYITVCATVQRLSLEQENGEVKSQLFITDPKSETSLRQIPIPSFLIPALQKKSETTTDDSFFLTSKTQRPMEPRTFQYKYKRLLHQAGVPYYNFHTLRHTFATRCITCGMDPKTLSEILGHSDIKITMDYYFHSSFEFKKNQIEKLTSLA